jgi:hypothetical protein
MVRRRRDGLAPVSDVKNDRAGVLDPANDSPALFAIERRRRIRFRPGHKRVELCDSRSSAAIQRELLSGLQCLHPAGTTGHEADELAKRESVLHFRVAEHLGVRVMDRYPHWHWFVVTTMTRGKSDRDRTVLAEEGCGANKGAGRTRGR